MHTLEIEYQSRLNTAWHGPPDKFYRCVEYSKQRVNFQTAAGHTYWFYAQNVAPKKHQVRVFESNQEKGGAAHEIPCASEQLDFRQHCGWFLNEGDCLEPVF
jgi:hypothetical protein